MRFDVEDPVFDGRGLVPVVVQDLATGAVLMVAWANREALERTESTGTAWFWSRSRETLWQKGETSGNLLRVVEGSLDCDGDTVLLRVLPTGPACHRGTRTCFDSNPPRLELGWLFRILQERTETDPGTSYTARLLAQGPGRIAQKVGEEAVETVVEALRRDPGSGLAEEVADLLYHLLVLLLARGESPEAVAAVLRDRHFGAPAPEEEGEVP
ncbi:MAG: bifunctional phosphoribosyl-AMP cyclohydrolase/phosphoribosyl-ATP diphosphatase HisIE [Thermoanaerobaculia bacterium]|nr:bifunctional phosphoribosyl-AMP cyclohydrolase/phosphoribosyl-ATP diphosphatase HisIE [Thermoanaerobaculia bacterium]